MKIDWKMDIKHTTYRSNFQIIICSDKPLFVQSLPNKQPSKGVSVSETVHPEIQHKLAWFKL